MNSPNTWDRPDLDYRQPIPQQSEVLGTCEISVVEHIKHGLHRCCADKREDGWISVATSLPKFDEFVDLWVTHAEGGGKRLADHSRVYVTNEGWYWCDEEGTAIEEFGYEPEDITHWRNRPAPPEASK